jgi:sec-independent protein translocase protein TatC
MTNKSLNEIPENSGSMGLMEHLHELRKRLVISLVAILIGSVITYINSLHVFSFLTQPFFSSFTPEQLIGTGPAEAFVLKLKTAVASGIVLVSPFLFLQIWLFISPGLYESEKKLALPFILFTSILFFIGVSFAYYVVLPFSLEFFKDEYVSIGITPAIRIGELLPLTVKLIIGFGFIFNLPILAYFLGRLGIINHKFLLKYFRHAVVLIFIVSAILTPPDVITQCLMAIPLLILYLISIFIVKYTAKKPIDF